MAPPLYVTSLIGLMHALDWPQHRIAERLQVSKTALSLWASGARPISKRYEQTFLDLVEAVLREDQSRPDSSEDHQQEVYLWVDTWSKEMFVHVMRYQQAIESALKIVQQFDASRHVLTMTPEDRERLRGACQEMLRHLDYCEALGLPETRIGHPEPRDPVAYFRELRQMYSGMDQGQEE